MTTMSVDEQEAKDLDMLERALERQPPDRQVTAGHQPRPTNEDPQPTQEPVDIFGDHPAPDMPALILPGAWQQYALDASEMSGFDSGAYLFLLLMHAGCMVDHRTRLHINSTWSEPPFHWAAIVDPSGGGKTPVLKSAGKFAMQQYAAITRESQREYSEWRQACAQIGTGESPERPPWRQRNADDTTVEGLRDALVNNPEGVTIAIDELTGWLGRMDAYNARSGKDRPAWLDAWSGQHHRVVNRSSSAPVVIPHWAAGVIGAIQPEALAQQFRRNGSSDGLFQRFLMYQMRPATEPDLFGQMNEQAEKHTADDFARLATSGKRELNLDTEATRALQTYIAKQRIVAARTASVRFTEHLGKFPGFVARIALTLHHINECENGARSATVEYSTMRDAIQVMRVLYRHSESIYEVLDGAVGDVKQLMQSAGEAILAKEWPQMTRGDLTRHATGWRQADPQSARNAIDLLVELGWLQDVTDVQTNRRGRRSDGRFAVNSRVHELFAQHAERTKTRRAERYDAIQELAAGRD